MEEHALFKRFEQSADPVPDTSPPSYQELKRREEGCPRDEEERSPRDEEERSRRISVPLYSSLTAATALHPNERIQRRTSSCKYPTRASEAAMNISSVVHPSNESHPVSSNVSHPSKESPKSARERIDSTSVGKSQSAPESRSCSWKTRKNRCRRSRVVSENDGKDDNSSSAATLEDAVAAKLRQVRLIQDEDCCVVRSFSTSSKGIINRGDSFRRKAEVVEASQTSDDSVFTNNNTDECLVDLTVEEQLSERLLQRPTWYIPDQTSSFPAKTTPNTSTVQTYTVLVMGDHDVGKTALLQQFMTSEYMGAAETSFDVECEKTVSVVLDGEETMLNFVDLPKSVQRECAQYTEIEAYVVCYSMTDRQSFLFAYELLCEFRRLERSDATIILVATKSDLVRSRKVSTEEGRSMCETVSCKYIEVSAAFNHCVDDLLAGLVHQIRLNSRRHSNPLLTSTHDNGKLISNSFPNFGCFGGAKAFLADLLLGIRRSRSRSCDNLWTL